MRKSIRTRFMLGMIFLFVIITVLSVFSGYYMNKLSKKTEAILKENYLSVIYARQMTEGLLNINQDITTAYLTKRHPDSSRIAKQLSSIDHWLDLEKRNFTEPGEDKLVAGFETGYSEYRDSLLKKDKLPDEDRMLFLHKESGDLFQQLLLLSEMNNMALEVKTDDAKASSKNALTRMTILATLCFLIGMSFTFSFASYFNRRFFQLYNGIKELVSSNFDQHLYFEGNDEFYEISLVFNEMADKLKKNKQKLSVTLNEEPGKSVTSADKEELDKMLFRLKTLEEQAAALISRFEKK